MKIVKRNGQIVNYDPTKISVAIAKANAEVPATERIEEDKINEIINYIESLGKKRMLVEDIQDIIETKLMEYKKYELAKKYIVYRYTRQLVRNKNTADESILGLIKRNDTEDLNINPFKDAVLASSQRDLIAGEVSKDLTRRMLLPPNIARAHENGVLYFHDSEYFLQSIFNCCIVDIKDMLSNGTMINKKMIETPKSFQVACNIVTQIMATVASNQYGGQAIDISALSPYLRVSKQKFYDEIKEVLKESIDEDAINQLVEKRLKYELSSGIQTMQYQINTLMTTNGQSPYVTLFLNLDISDPYIEETASIIEEILKQRIQGIKDEKGNYSSIFFPKLVYVLNEYNNLEGNTYDYLTELAVKCSLKRTYPDFISSKVMKELFKGEVFSPMEDRMLLSPYKDKDNKYKWVGRFNQGLVTINLPQIGILAQNDEHDFFKLLDDRLDLCKEALMCRHYALLDTPCDVSPIHWKRGAISRFKDGQVIDELLKDGYSTLSLGYIGLYETTMLVKGVSPSTEEGKAFALKLINKLNRTLKKWKDESNLAFTLYATPADLISSTLYKLDIESYGTVDGITDKGYYSDSFYLDENIDVYEKLKFETEFQKLTLGGSLIKVKVNELLNEETSIKDVIKYIYNNVLYIELI